MRTVINPSSLGKLVRGTLLLTVALAAAPPSGLGASPVSPPVAVDLQPAPARLTIGQAVQLALQHNPDRQRVANQVDSAAITLDQAHANLLPDLRLGLTASERFARETDPVTGSRDGSNGEVVSGSLASAVNLFNGFGDLASIRGAAFTLAALRDDLSRSEQDLVFSTVSQFLEGLTTQELITVRIENLAANRRQLEQIDALYRAGNRPVSDLYQQQAETANAELDLLLAQRDDTVARLQLLQSLGLRPTGAVRLESPDLSPLESAFVAGAAGPVQDASLEQRPDLLARQKQIEAAREQVVQAQAGYWPTLDLSAAVASDYSSEAAAGFNRQFFDDRPQTTLGLALSVPLFDRFLTRNNVAQARIRERDAQLALVSLSLQASADSSQAEEDFQTARKLIGVTEAQLTAAREALAATEERYRVGAATLTELTQSRTQFVQAGFDRIRARFGLLRQGVARAYYQGDWSRLRSLLAQLETPQ